jgi:hypothetical protein
MAGRTLLSGYGGMNRWGKNKGAIPLRENPDHVLLQPFLQTPEVRYLADIEEKQGPYRSHYRQGYFGLGCELGVEMDLPERSERTGYDQIGEEIMKPLNAMGYF